MAAEMTSRQSCSTRGPASGLLQEGIEIAAPRSVEYVHAHFQFGFFERGHIDEFFAARGGTDKHRSA